MENKLYLPTQKGSENSGMFKFCKSLMSSLIEDIWILISASAGNLLWYVNLAEVYEENSASYWQVIRKGKSILIALSGNYRYSSLILYQNITSGSFLKVSGYVGSEMLSVNFSLVYLAFWILKH